MDRRPLRGRKFYSDKVINKYIGQGLHHICLDIVPFCAKALAGRVATHFTRSGVDLRYIQTLLGYNSSVPLKSTTMSH